MNSCWCGANIHSCLDRVSVSTLLSLFSLVIPHLQPANYTLPDLSFGFALVTIVSSVMPPKRTTFSSTKKATKRRFSSRLSNGTLDENNNMTDPVLQPKRSRRSTKSRNSEVPLSVLHVGNDNSMNSESRCISPTYRIFVWQINLRLCSDEEPMDSVNSSASNVADDTNEQSSACSAIDLLPIRPSESSIRVTSFDDDDNDDQFRRTFMNIVPSFRPTTDRISTPLSQRDNRSHRSNLNNDCSHR